MLNKINQFIVACSESWWKFLIIFLGQTLTMQALFRITAEFPAISAGNEPFDMQNNLKPEQIFTQLEAYTDRAFDQYMLFQGIDYLFPLFAGLLLATICAFSLRHASQKYYALALNNNLFVLLLVPTVFDWLENIHLLRVILVWPDQARLAANMAVVAKMAKLGTMQVGFAVTAILLLWATVAWTSQRFRGANSS